MEENQGYQRTISLRTIYLTLIRRTEWILIIFLPLVLGSFIVTNFILAKKYTSNAKITCGGIDSTSYSLVQKNMTTNDIYLQVEKELKNDGVKHNGGKGAYVTAEELAKGVSFSSFASGMVDFTISFTSSDASITKDVLTTYTDVAMAAYPTWPISSPASDPVKTSSENKYFLIAVAAAAVLALGIPFIYEIVADQIFEKKDITLLGAEGFELRASGK